MGLSAATLRDTVDAIQRLETQQMNGILRRFFLVRLLGYYKETTAAWDQPTASVVSRRGTKRATWVINQMMSEVDPTVIHPAQVGQGPPEYRVVRKRLMNQLGLARKCRFCHPLPTSTRISLGSCARRRPWITTT